MHWPEGCLVAAARMLLNVDAARSSYVAGKYTQALAEAHVATWDILRMPVDSRNIIGGKHGLPDADDIRAHLGYTKPG